MLKNEVYSMNVRLISYSQPSKKFLEETDMSSISELVAYCARVSNPANQQNTETDKLINYLIKHKHWSPLEMVNMALEIETTRDIARQILRHRSFSFQEFSQRYADPTKDLSFSMREARLQDPKNRQNSISEGVEPKLILAWYKKQAEIINMTKDTYDWAIANGIAKEQARAVLPEGLTVSRLYMSGTLRSWIHYIQIRSGIETQKEHREVAIACANALEPIFPMIRSFING